ncbi:MAG: hypothetical protein ACRDYW_04130 [Acidimicrobiales bacterium]
MRRSLAALGVAVVLLVGSAGWASAGESIPDGAWQGSALDAGPRGIEANSYKLSGTFRRRFVDRQIQVTVSADPPGSGPCAVQPITLPGGSTPHAFSATLSIPCNGTYALRATANTTDNGPLAGPESATLDRTVVIAGPAPKVTGVTLEPEPRAVTVSWDDMRAAAPDLSGYIVERQIGDGDVTELATLPVDELAFTDEGLPDAAGEATYRVRSTRPAAGETVVSRSSDPASTPFESAADNPGGSSGDGGGGADGGASGDGDGSTGSGDGGEGGSAGGSGGRGGDTNQPSRIAPPKVFSGTFLPPLLRPVTLNPTTPTTVDEGFSEQLPYGDRAQPADLPGDGFASIFTEGRPGRGLVIPAAIALVLAAWGVHLRLLARASRPVD